MEPANSSNLEQFNITEAALTELEQNYSIAPNATTKDGYEQCVKALKVLRPLRTGVDKMRLSLNKDDQERIKKRNSEAKKITGRIVALEEPIKSAKDAVDQAAERIKQEKIAREKERVDAHQAAILEIVQMVAENTVDGIEKQLASLAELSPENFEEFSDDAQKAITNTTARLNTAKETIVELDKHRIETDRIAAEQAARKAEQDARQAEIEAKEQRIKDAQLEAEIKANAEKEAKIEAEKAEQKRLTDLEKAEKKRIADLAKQQQEIEEKQKADEKERLAKEEAELAEKKRIAENIEHRKKINRSILNKIISIGTSESSARSLISSVAKGDIDNLVITY